MRGGGPAPERRKWWTLTAVCVPLFLVALNSTAVNTALPAISDQLDTSTANLAWVVNAYLLVTAAVVVLGGQFGDMFGRRRMFLLGVVVFAVASVVIATGDSEIQLVAGRGLQGLAAAFILPGSMALIGVAFPPGERASAMGIWAAIAGLGFALGPVFGGVLTDTLGWEWVWWANLPATALAIPLILYAVAESRDESMPRKVDFAGVLTLGAGLFLLVLAIVQGQSWGWGSARIIGLLAVAVVLLVTFVVIERRVSQPLVHLQFFRIPAFTIGNVGTFTATMMVFGVLYLDNLYFQNFLLLNASAISSGALLLPLSGALFVVSLVVGKLIERFGARWILTTGFVLQAAGLIWASQASPESGSAFFVAPLLVTGIGIGLAFGPSSGIGVSAVPDNKAGEASGVNNVSRYLGAGIGIAVLTVLYTGIGLSGLNDRLGADRVDARAETTLDRIQGATSNVAERDLGELPAPERSDFETAAREATTEAFAAGNLFMAGLALACALGCAIVLGGHRHPKHHHLTHRRAGPATVVTTTSHHAVLAGNGADGTRESPGSG